MSAAVPGKYLPHPVRWIQFLQHLADGIHHAQEPRCNFGIQHELAISQASEKIFTYVRHLLELVETQESASAFNRVDGAKHAGERLCIAWILLESNELSVQAVEVLVAFLQEVFNDVGITHR